MPPEGPVPKLDRELMEGLESEFSGEIEQLPPPYSAKKVGGKKLYELARKGESVEIEPKTVRVDRLALQTRGDDCIEVEATVSTGFYVRSLAHDVGQQLGCGGHLLNLQRLSIGLRGELHGVEGDDIPFEMLPFIQLRGIPALRYQGEVTAVAEAEARWAFHRRVSGIALLRALVNRTW